ncbi:GAF domain-containing protein [Desemzia sp. RIT804]|uniref:GAF domain-containing protein n=1 Tax=Desemzia sp. RIT 804 TaxID=2810209 RepID=UPI00194E3E11|nr:GAF domain-containing protein [Desemzia sp. RIT 804]MBM6613529.1 GAF domain-containing protein [Desemzia sp. RIT 804]
MSKEKKYQLMNNQLRALLAGEKNLIANLSNASALLFESLPEINWSGFYLYEEASQELVLGPFQGKVACVRIQPGKGVCGTAFEQKNSIVVEDVNQFPGHIACDAASQSEVVVPLQTSEGDWIGVLDIDAPITNRFDEIDRKYLEEFATILMDTSVA